MIPYADFTWQEITSQPDAWNRTLAAVAQQEAELDKLANAHDYERIVLTGCGSTYYLALAAAAALREIAGRDAVGLPASEVWLNPAGSFPGHRSTLLIAISRSAETTETIRAVESFQKAGRGPVMTLTCYGERQLAQMGDLNLVIEAGQERSIAQTRAFSSLYLASLAFATRCAGSTELYQGLQQLANAGTHLLQRYHHAASNHGTDTTINRCFFLGSGARYGLAAELSLKMKEMSLSESEPFHTLEYRHGPQSMARPGTLIIGLLSDSNRSQEEAVLNEMQALGATVVRVGTGPADVQLPAIPEPIRGPLYLPFGQMLAYERSISRGLTPDSPSQLEAVVRLEV